MPTPALPTFDELRDAAQNAITTDDPRLTDFSEGSALDAIAGSAATMGSASQRHLVYLARASFVETADGADLDKVITDRGGPVRQQPSPARVTLRLVRGAYVGAHTIASGEAITGEAADGTVVTFEADDAAVLGSGDASVEFDATCATTGRRGNVAADTLTTIAGLPSGLTIEQDERAAGGSEGEPYTDAGDATYRARYRLSRQALQGTPEALRFAALSVPGVTYAEVDESNIACEDGGYVALLIGDPDAEGNSTLAEEVDTALDTIEINGRVGVRAAGVEVVVLAAAREEGDFVYDVIARAGAGVTTTEIRDAVAAYLDTLGPGQTHYPSQGEAAILDLGRDRILDVIERDPADTAEHAGPRVPSAQQNAIRTASNLSDITVNITEV